MGSLFAYKMEVPGAWPDDMEWVPSGTFPLFMPGIDHLDEEPMAGFLMDRDPVTNRAFKRFVDDGGYRNAALWPETLAMSDGPGTRADLMRQLVDATGQPGPAGWEGGTHAGGEDELPVAGVSWYEAAAYAMWAGKCLPTLFHWNRVALTCASAQIIAQSNLAGRALAPVGSTHSQNRFGVRDLAGNVREWVFNATGDGKRFLLGGAWNDPEYAFNDAWAQAPLDRSATNGFRCIRPVEPEHNQERLTRVIELPTRDFRAETPVPDSVFQFFVRQFAYDHAPLADKLESEDNTVLGRMQTVTIAAAYGGERLTIYVFLPERPGPHQPVVVFPGSNAIHTRVFNPLDLRRVDFLVRSGRAVVLPVYKGTYHRGGDIHSDYPSETASYRDYVIMWARDLGRTIDYLESRADLDAANIGYYGLSWGGYMGAILPAIERRIRANVLYVAGLTFQRALPEVDAIHYITRVTQPTLMLNGELDFFFPVETSQKPMFDLLGTPPEHKRRFTYPGGHSVPRVETIRHTLEWFDRYLGPVGG
jgi:dienelactone hydrolase